MFSQTTAQEKSLEYGHIGIISTLQQSQYIHKRVFTIKIRGGKVYDSISVNTEQFTDIRAINRYICSKGNLKEDNC